MIRYKNIAELMRKNGISTYDVKKQGLLSQSTMTRLHNNGVTSIATINVLCRLLHCQPGDILEYIEDRPEE